VPPIADLSKKLGINPGAPVAFLLSIGICIMFYVYGWLILITSLTVIYPSMKSILAIHSETDADDKVWLTYWMVFGVFVAIETFFGFFLNYVPYWDVIRLFIFVWLLIPYFNGATILYNYVLRPLLADNQDKI